MPRSNRTVREPRPQRPKRIRKADTDRFLAIVAYRERRDIKQGKEGR